MNTIKNQNWIPTKGPISATLLVAALTGSGYLSAFAYQFFYLKYFGIPVFFVDVNLVNVLLATSIGFLCLLGLVPYFDFLLRSKQKNKPINFIKNLFAIFVIVATITIPILALFFNLNNNAVLITILIILVAIVIGSTIYIQKYPERTNNQIKEDNSLLSRAEKLFGSFPVRFIVMLILLIIWCGGVGILVAQSTTNFLVPNTNSELVIVSTYSGNFIGLTFNSDKKTFDKNMTLISQAKISDDNIVFYNKKIGPLKSNQDQEN